MTHVQSAPPRRSTIIAGVGAVTGYGWGFDALVSGVASGASSGAKVCVDGTATLAAIVPTPEATIDETQRVETAVGHAAEDAMLDASARGWAPGQAVGVIHCTGIGDIRTMRDLYLRPAAPRPSQFPRLLHTSIPSLLAQRHAWTGPNLVLNAACASGNMALMLANDWLVAGRVTDVIVTGAEFCVIGEIVDGFRRMRVLLGIERDIADCRPFQAGSRGFFLGEAAVAFVLSSNADAPRARYLGGASTHDAHHLVAMDPTGAHVERCIRTALDDSGVSADDIGLLKAHGSGTAQNDRIEGEVADRVFGDITLMCSYKALLGHCMGVSALAELAGVLASWESGCYPTPVTADQAHSRLLAEGAPPPGPVVCVSVGLGGSNAAVVIANDDTVAGQGETK